MLQHYYLNIIIINLDLIKLIIELNKAKITIKIYYINIKKINKVNLLKL